MLFTSRPEENIRTRLDRFVSSGFQVRLGSRELSNDIRRYVSSFILRYRSEFEIWTRDELKNMEDTLVEKADGMCVASFWFLP